MKRNRCGAHANSLSISLSFPYPCLTYPFLTRGATVPGCSWRALFVIPENVPKEKRKEKGAVPTGICHICSDLIISSVCLAEWHPSPFAGTRLGAPGFRFGQRVRRGTASGHAHGAGRPWQLDVKRFNATCQAKPGKITGIRTDYIQMLALVAQ